MRLETLTLSTNSARLPLPPARLWWRQSTVRAFPWSTLAVHTQSTAAKGQKANKKRMATFATVFTRAPWVRSPQQVIESLFPASRPASGAAPPPPRPENQRVWASLLRGKTAVIEEVAKEMEHRDPRNQRRAWP
jgi:hypothetical protein